MLAGVCRVRYLPIMQLCNSMYPNTLSVVQYIVVLHIHNSRLSFLGRDGGHNAEYGYVGLNRRLIGSYHF